MDIKQMIEQANQKACLLYTSTNLSGEVEYTYAPDVRPLSPVPPETFQGYRRADGRVGVRNELWIIPTVGCVNDCAKACLLYTSI